MQQDHRRSTASFQIVEFQSFYLGEMTRDRGPFCGTFCRILRRRRRNKKQRNREERTKPATQLNLCILHVKMPSLIVASLAGVFALIQSAGVFQGPLERIVCDFFPSSLAEGVVCALRKFLVFGNCRCLAVQLVVGFHYRRWRYMVLTAGNQQQRSTI